jgi:Sulfotransferase domain
MSARILTIVGKQRPHPLALASLDDFQYREGEAIDPQVVLTRSTLSLYCVDPPNHRAIFVDTAPDVDLSAAPFYYQAQYDAAQRLISVPYDTLHALASAVPLDPRRLIVIYSVGRCGSTLVSHVLNQAEGVVSISEPDVYTQLLTRRAPDGSHDSEVRALVRSCTQVMCASSARRGGASAWALKFRSVVIGLADLLYHHFPEAKVVFLYRQAESWARSMARAFRLLDPEIEAWLPPLQPLVSRFMPVVAAPTAQELAPPSPLAWLSYLWVSVMERCVDLQRQGVPMFVARYEDLQAAPHEVLEALFAYCAVTARDAGAIGRVLAQDAQAGTSLSREHAQGSTSAFGAQHVAELHRLIRTYAPMLTPDFVMPQTFRRRTG